MSELTTDAQTFFVNEIEVRQDPIQVSMGDGAVLHGDRYRRMTPVGRGKNSIEALAGTLLCIPSELGRGSEYHAFALELCALPGAPSHLVTLDLRGRGRSLSAPCADTDISTDADDIVSFCDALNLHHIDFLVSGRSSAAVLLTAPKRPSLIRKLILNDAAPEYDSVGIARQTARKQRQSAPSDWAQAAETMRALKGEDFPEFGEEDWQHLARVTWLEKDGKPLSNYSRDLARYSNAVVYDERQTTLWPEFSILKDRPALLIKGAHSSLVSQTIVDQMTDVHSRLEVVEAEGQGHCPQLHKNGLPEDILAFLRG